MEIEDSIVSESDDVSSNECSAMVFLQRLIFVAAVLTLAVPEENSSESGI
jgi:hypothetical protein